jgi:hypothetical protein
VFGIGRATRIYLAAGPTDMRKGFEGLYPIHQFIGSLLLHRRRGLPQNPPDKTVSLCG